MVTTNGITANPAGAPKASPTVALAASSARSIVRENAAQGTAPAISPRLVVDPRAGVLIQYLNNNGEVATQIPSTTVVAYLRAGLTAEGLNKPPAQPLTTTTTEA